MQEISVSHEPYTINTNIKEGEMEMEEKRRDFNLKSRGLKCCLVSTRLSGFMQGWPKSGSDANRGSHTGSDRPTRTKNRNI